MPSLKIKIVDILIVLITCLLLSLGFWQLERAKQKQALINRIHNPADNASNIKNFEEYPPSTYEMISCEANINLNKAILLDNQYYNHQHGVRALAVANCNGTDKLLLVDRGWISKKDSFSVLSNKDYEGQIQGLSIWPSSGILLKAQSLPENIEWPLTLQKLDVTLIESALNNKIFSTAIRLPPEHELSFAVSEIKISTSPQKHNGYATQWFSLALVLVIYYSVNRRKVTQNGSNK